MNWYRSWPLAVPEGRAYVEDSLPRLPMTRCDYRTIETWPRDQPGFCMLEWDIALGKPERDRFEAEALERPNEVLVAPYEITIPGSGVQCVHRLTNLKPIPVGFPGADFFGFGCIYFPQPVLTEFLGTVDLRFERFSDHVFSDWYRKRYGRCLVTWTVRPQHLHGD